MADRLAQPFSIPCEAPSGAEAEALSQQHQPAFELTLSDDPPLPVLIGAPHGGRTYPTGIDAAMRDADFAKLKLEDRLVDRLADDVARATGAGLLVARAPRALIDLNRAPDDIDWSMISDRTAPKLVSGATNRRARNGLGLVPRRLPGYGEIWKNKLTQEELEARIATIHHPYHTTLGTALESMRDKWGAVLLLDLHSMPPLKSSGPSDLPAEFVVGDRFGSSCADSVSASALAFLASSERRVAHNRPYSGGYVLDRHGAPRRGIHAMQLEICRSIYLDPGMREAGPRFAGVVRLLSGLVRTLAGDVIDLRGGAPYRHAAE